jgi:hypothetical protein
MKMDCARSSSRLGRLELFKKGYVNYASTSYNSNAV